MLAPTMASKFCLKALSIIALALSLCLQGTLGRSHFFFTHNYNIHIHLQIYIIILGLINLQYGTKCKNLILILLLWCFIFRRNNMRRPRPRYMRICGVVFGKTVRFGEAREEEWWRSLHVPYLRYWGGQTQGHHRDWPLRQSLWTWP